MSEAASPLLSVEGLTIAFRGEAGQARVVDSISLSIGAGEAVGLVGESGCGKSVTAMSVMRLLPTPPAVIEAGEIRFEGGNLLALSEAKMRALRGDRIGMIFQEPMTSLNPTFTVGYQIAEVLTLHRGMNQGQARAEAARLLTQVGVGAAERRLAQYPHQLSGGLRQRVMIAMAIACGPKLLIADEPTTALDVTIQAQILDLLRRLRAEFGMALLLITHDLGVVSELCDRVIVMYAGRIVEEAPARALFSHAYHPYTAGLLASRPKLGETAARLPTIPGSVPPPNKRGIGCNFADRCARAQSRCRTETPVLAAMAAGHRAACFNPVP
jgi:oligopeptide/dipeptide ABC transporter ATP-binding protein